MADNWVERRARRDQKLKDITVWMDARAAIADCCASFQRHYADLASVECEEVNGHCTRVFVIFGKRIPGQPVPPNQQVVAVEIAFDPLTPQIVVTIGEKVTRFPIDANEERAFIFHGVSELSADDFSKAVLEVIFFARPKAAKRSSPPSHTTTFS